MTTVAMATKFGTESAITRLNRSPPGVNLNDAVKLAVAENHILEPNMKWIGMDDPSFEIFEMRGRSSVVGLSSIYTYLQ